MTATQLPAPPLLAKETAWVEEVTHTEPLVLELSLAEAWPWPGMIVRAAARLGSTLLRLKRLKPHPQGFLCNGVLLAADNIDALVVRAVSGLPSVDGVAFRAQGGQFAPLLSLIRQAGENVIRRDTPRLADTRVLRSAPRPALTVELLSKEELKLRASAQYRCAESGANLGLPMHREGGWWAFNAAVSPEAQPLDEPLLDALFTAGAQEYAGAAARAFLRAVRELQPDLDIIWPAELAAQAAQAARAEALSVEHKETPLRAPEAATVLPERKERDAEQDLDDIDAAPVYDDEPPAREVSVDEIVSPWNVYTPDSADGAEQVVAMQPLDLRLESNPDDDLLSNKDIQSLDGKPLSEKDIAKLMKLRKQWLREMRGVPAQPADSRRSFSFRPPAYVSGRPAALETVTIADEREKIGDLYTLAGTNEHQAAYKSFLERLQAFDEVEPVTLPEGFKLPLRPYQLQGYQWLRFLTRFGLNGILADEMGLGKTAQTIALLGALREHSGPWPSLIICPTSLVDNWCNEVLKFDPRLKVLRYRGSPARRDWLRRRICDVDLVIATYATARNDASLLREEQWRCLILDEAHTIKNSAAATTRALKTIPSRHRLALTGTPIQNRLDELWSLFDFLMPGYLGRYTHFFREFEERIVRGQAAGADEDARELGVRAAELLRERIGPFVLRRLKTDVAKDLPEKIEQDVQCPLTPDQAALYRKFVNSDEAREAIAGSDEMATFERQAKILAALTTLRKICNHPDLIYLGKEVGAGKKIVPLPGFEERAGKLPALADLLDQCKAGGHRALIFSQHTSTLDILEQFMKNRREEFLRLDGSVPGTARQGLVDRFNGDDSILAFLISTRAGGSGLNLTGADVVIFYDHDWNPANDRQAQDRAWRIGQTRVVNVYRLVTQGTLEEKILERQERKSQLAQSVVQHDVGGVKDFSRDELISLFTYRDPEKTQ